MRALVSSLKPLLSATLFAPTLLLAQEPSPWPLLKPAPPSMGPLAGSDLLEEDGDLSLRLVEANDRFLDREIERAAQERSSFWKRDLSSGEAYAQSVQPNRERLARMLGIDRENDSDPEEKRHFLFHSLSPQPLHEDDSLRVHEVSWWAFGEVSGHGHLYEPRGETRAKLLLLLDADVSATCPGWVMPLARKGCRILVLRPLERSPHETRLSQREWIQRPAFVLGRTLTGYELLLIRSAIDCLGAEDPPSSPHPLAVAGHGEGGRLALFAAALDERIQSVLISGAFGPRESLWQEPADHNIFGLLREFGDAEIASLIWPRQIVIEQGTEPDYGYRRREDTGQLEQNTAEHGALPGKPGRLARPSLAEVAAEGQRLRRLVPLPDREVSLISAETAFSKAAVARLLEGVGMRFPDEPPQALSQALPDSKPLLESLKRHNQQALLAAASDRKRYFRDLKTDSLETFEQSIEPYRDTFRTEVIGDFARPLLPPRARTRPYQEGEKTRSYEVVLDVMESGGETVFAYGILTLPKDLDLASGERRPVVVCQHGLEGSPQDLLGEQKHRAYQAFATRLAERGFITFAPQNGYKYFDLFRMQQFKAQSIGRTLFSLIVPQHRQLTDWLASQSWVDADRIAFYGLSYGGKSAMRIPPLVERYCLSICSGDFNEWVWKNAATDPESLRYSYANKGEYEIFEWNLGGSFNYAEMAALICPRPFMVERGHFDGVAPDEQVAFEFAKVRHLYAAKLNLADRCAIEWFPGPHAIHGVGSYAFLHRHLQWPEPESPRQP